MPSDPLTLRLETGDGRPWERSPGQGVHRLRLRSASPSPSRWPLNPRALAPVWITVWIMVWVVVWGMGLAGASPAWAQRKATFDAVPGRPFGVARMTLSSEAGAAETIKQSEFRVEDTEGRVFYAVCRQGRVGRLLGKTLGVELPIGRLEVFFLFRGVEPLDITVYTPRPRGYVLTPKGVPPRIADEIREEWWSAYREAAQAEIEEGDFNPVVPIYLTSMLGRRMGLSLNEQTATRGQGMAAAAMSSLVDRNLNALRPQAASTADSGGSLALLFGLESLRTETVRAAMRGEFQVTEGPTQPLPPPIEFPRSPPLKLADNLAAKVAVEPLAKRVPADWFYLRFGRLANQNWLNKLANEHGGDLSRMVMLRGLRNSGSQRLETQLALPSPRNSLEEVVGDAMIADCALVGRDLFLNDGAAVGVLFQMRTALFASNVATHRKEVAERERAEGCVQTVERIAGRDVPFLSTPDNRRRSFFVQDGDYLLVTNSRSMAERFLTLTEAGDTLAASDSFQQARSLYPLDRNHAVFAHFTPAFFQGLLSPEYQIELQRRLRSLATRQLLELARWASASENLGSDRDAERSDTPVADLVAAGYLPPGIGDRRESGGWTLRDGRWVDELRGAAGSFLPIPDMTIATATPRELSWYRKQAEFYAVEWRPLDPLTIAIRRGPMKDGREPISLDARLALNEQSKYGQWLAKIGPLSKTAIDPGPETPIFLQAHLRDDDKRNAPPHHLFVGIADVAPSNVEVGGLLSRFGGTPALRLLRSTPGYVGSWPVAGYLDQLPFMGAGRQAVDPNGYSQLPLGIVRRQWNDFSVIALDPQLLAPLPEQLQIVNAKTPAQIRLSVADPTLTRLPDWINRISYERARQASIGNSKLLNMLHLQLGVPIDEARTVAERLLDAEMVCPVGGDYQPVRTATGNEVWRSTAWNDEASTSVMPAAYQSPVLSWFRGLSAEVEKHPDHLALHADLVLEHVLPATTGPAPSPPAARPTPAPNTPTAPVAPEANRPASRTPSLKLPFQFNIFGSPPEKPGTTPVSPAGPAKPTDPRPSDPKSGDPQTGEPKSGDPPPSDSKRESPKLPKPKSMDSKPSDAKPSDAKPSDAKPSDSKPSDAKPIEVKPDAVPRKKRAF